MDGQRVDEKFGEKTETKMSAEPKKTLQQQKDEYQEKYSKVLENKEYEKFNKALRRAAEKNYPRKLQVLLDLVKEKKVENSLETKHLLRTAMTFSHRGYEASELIMEEFKAQHLTSNENEETILHIAVARQDVEGARLILDKLAENNVLLHEYLHVCMKISEDSKKKNSTKSCMEQQLPLSMAAWNCDIKMIDLLVKKGASLKETNDRKQNVFHSLVEASAAAEDDHLIKEVIKTCEHFLKNLGKDSLFKSQNLAEVLSTRDENGNTPLTLAAEKGCREMFEVIANCQVYKSLDETEGISHTYLYDVTEIDSALCKDQKSAMHRVLAGSYKNQEKFHEFADIDPILDLIRIKWDSYKWWFLAWGVVHFGLMAFHLAMTVAACRKEKVCPVLSDAIVGFYGFLLLSWEVYQLVWRRNIKISVVGNGWYQILLLVFGVSAVVTPFLHFIPDQPATAIPRSIALVIGCVFLTFFTKGIKVFSAFTVMMQRALTDVFRFSVIYLCFLFPYSVSMTMLFSSGQSEQFATIWKSLFNIFSVTLGLVDIELDVLLQSDYPWLTTTLYVTFLISSYILLLNMVIALLSDTCSQVSSIHKDQWHLQKMGIVLFIEARLLEVHRCKGGTFRSPKLLNPKIRKSSQLQTPKCLDPRLLPEEIKPMVIRHDFSQRCYLEKTTITQRSFREYREAEDWWKKVSKSISEKTQLQNISNCLDEMVDADLGVGLTRYNDSAR